MALPVSWNGTGLATGALTIASAGTGDTPFGELGGAPTIASTGATPPRVQFPAATANSYAGWLTGALGTIGSYTVSTLFEFASIGSASWSIASGATGSTVAWRIDLAGSGSVPPAVLRLRDGSAQLAASTQALTAGTLYRLEVVASGASITATVYAGTTSTIAAGPITGTASSATINAVRFGNFSSSTANPVQSFDAMGVAAPTATIASAATLASTSALAATATTFTPTTPPPAPVERPDPFTATPPPSRTDFFVMVRDASLARVGGLAPRTLQFTARHNDVGEWRLTLPADAANADRLQAPGAGILIYRAEDMALLMSGPVGSLKLSQTEEGLVLEASGPDDNVWISGRLAYQEPTRTPETQGSGTAKNWKETGPAESVMKHLVEANAGQSAQGVRRVVTVAPVAATPRGATASTSTRMSPLLDHVRRLGETGGLGWRVTQAGTALVFDVYVPANRTGTARFSAALGNLDAFDYTRTAPSSTFVGVGGQGQGLARAFKSYTDTEALTAWPRWRREVFIDQRQAEDTADLDEAAFDELAQNGPQTSLSISTRDTAQTQFGRDYFVGDRVTVEPAVGATVQDLLREVTVAWTPEGGVTVVTRVGTYDTTGTPKILRALRRLQSKSAAPATVE